MERRFVSPLEESDAFGEARIAISAGKLTVGGPSLARTRIRASSISAPSIVGCAAQLRLVARARRCRIERDPCCCHDETSLLQRHHPAFAGGDVRCFDDREPGD